MELDYHRTQKIRKDIKLSIEEIEYMIRETVDIDIIKDDDLIELNFLVQKLWWILIKLSP